MKDLLLLRHAKAEEGRPHEDDFSRGLTKRGRHAARVMAGWLVHHGIHPDLILCSAALRTRQTLDPILAACAREATVELSPQLYLADVDTILERLCAIPEKVRRAVVIGHNPGIHELAALLAGDESTDQTPAKTRLKRKFVTAGLARFRLQMTDWAKLRDHAGSSLTRLQSYVTPNEAERGN